MADVVATSALPRSKTRVTLRTAHQTCKSRYTANPVRDERDATVPVFSRSLLIERLNLENSLSLMCPRFLIFIMISLFLSMGLIGFGVEQQFGIDTLLVRQYDLESLRAIRSLGSMREYMEHFARTASSFYPVNAEYVPDPDRKLISVGLNTFATERALPADLHPTLRTSFSLTAWVGAPTETWIIRHVQRDVSIRDPLEVCWGWRYPAHLVFGFHDLSVDQPSGRMQPEEARVWPAPGVSAALSFEAVVVNASHATFYRDAALLATQPLRRPVTDCDRAKLLVGDSTSVRIGQLTYYPRELSRTELYEIQSDGMSLLDSRPCHRHPHSGLATFDPSTPPSARPRPPCLPYDPPCRFAPRALDATAADRTALCRPLHSRDWRHGASHRDLGCGLYH